MSEVSKLKIGNTSYDIKDSNACKQLSSMPTASADYENKIIQYIGTTTQDYINGYYYKCVSNGENPATYSWQRINTQPQPTPSDIGAISTTAKGASNGVAELDSTGHVPSSQLPSYVDDVIEGYYKEADGKFYEESTYTTEIIGETGKIYLSLDTNKTYRWSGSAFVTIASDLALGETDSTAYRGDRGAAAYAHAVTNKGIAAASGLYKITTNSEGHVTNATAVAASDIQGLTGISLTTEEVQALIALLS